ncbi:hypothetical protein PINS_up006195 [Pythium insidiosum]|nr:hypothetical protein PINS_up006195 [Pythium insidiosum]
MMSTADVDAPEGVAVSNAASNSAEADCTPRKTTRDAEIDEVMEFLRFSVKPTTSFEGAILFKFRDVDGKDESTYLVEISKSKEVTTRKDASASDARSLTCEVTISVDDFLWIYSGKASSSDVLKLFYAGRLCISGYAFRKVSTFAQSFDYSSERWRKFYAWREEEANMRRSSLALDDAHNVGSPSRDFWIYHCRAILERYNISKLQRMTWEASLSSMFGDRFVLECLCRSATSRRSFVVPSSACSRDERTEGLVAALVGLHLPQSKVEHELGDVLRPCFKRRHSIPLELVRPTNENAGSLFDFFDDDYLDAVKHSAKQRHLRGKSKNRVDLADASMEQLDRLLKALGRDGHSNHQRKTKPKHIPVPELLLREFRAQASEIMHVIQEKALGRKFVDRIPLPDTAWLYGGDAGVLVVSDTMAPAEGNPSTRERASEVMPRSTQTQAAPARQALVVVNRSQVQRRSSKRDLIPKELLKAKLASLSRDLVKHQPPALQTEDHLIFSDYV